MRCLSLFFLGVTLVQAEPREWSGIYPHLAYFNNEGECGTGAVVPWADRLWVITYGPHRPYGSSDQLYEITPELEIIARPESVGGTPANRMIHRESNQLIIGPYFIDAQRQVRVIPPSLMPGRLTGNARHLTDPTHKIYFATMEDGLYEVDVHTLAVKGLIKEIKNRPAAGQTAEVSPATISSTLPGYHAKGLYSGQGSVIISNNGEDSPAALKNPEIVSGALGQWSGQGNWDLIRRNQFTEVTGPGGIYGNAQPATDPIWTIGWDHRSLILMVKEEGQWTTYRLPKASHTYDGAHGWNTEWPRIRSVGDPQNLLMTMHGMFWNFPIGFSSQNSAGLTPRSTYLKVIGDFTTWKNQLVFGCDDTARSEFLNKRSAKGNGVAPGQSQSNLWFTPMDEPDHLGPALGRGAVWLAEPIQAETFSDPFLLNGFSHRLMMLTHDGTAETIYSVDIDYHGDGEWTPWADFKLKPTEKNRWIEIPAEVPGTWLRIKSSRAQSTATVAFQYSQPDLRTETPDPIFSGLSLGKSSSLVGAFLITADNNQRSLMVVGTEIKEGETVAKSLYVLTADMKLVKQDNEATRTKVLEQTVIKPGALSVDEASVIFEDEGKRWRLPRSAETSADVLIKKGALRIAREVCTERDLLQAHGTFYELPALNAGGAIRLRPIASSNFAIHDFCSYRGLLVLSGVSSEAVNNNHLIQSADGQAKLWLGAVDDLWKLGKPRGRGGPWKKTVVTAQTPSDPYLMTGYDKKSVRLENHSAQDVAITLELDVTGDGHFLPYRTFKIPAGKITQYAFPDYINAYWVRCLSSENAVLSVEFTYQ